MACTLLLLILAGCSESERSRPATPTAATVAAPLDAGPVAPQRPVDAGSLPPPAPVDAGSPAQPLQRVPSLKLRPVASEEAFIRAHARDEGWDTSAERLKSYWHPASQVEERGLGRFTLGHLSNPDEPRGGRQVWILLRQHGESLAAYGPLITQAPWTPDYMHKVKPLQMTLRTLEGSRGRLLWVQMQDKLTSPLDPQGEQLESKIRLLDYGFLVDEQGGFIPIAFQLPERSTVEVNDETKAETTLVVDFPSADQMVITSGPEGASPEQRVWIGRHIIGR